MIIREDAEFLPAKKSVKVTFLNEIVFRVNSAELLSLSSRLELVAGCD